MVNETSRRLPADGTNFDLLVIGGGIVGSGVARDAALRGLTALLVEQSDFASGTSSRSSRLLHGGLRYLGQGRVGLVWEASAEKMRLSRLAPHLCRPLGFVFPTWRGSNWPRWQLALGVRVYDLLCGGRNLGKSAAHGPDGVLAKVPGLRADGLTGGVSYFDALTNDARLVIDTLRSAEAAGATLLNYAAYLGGDPVTGGWRCAVRDNLSGESATVTAKAVVNAAGAWAAVAAAQRRPTAADEGRPPRHRPRPIARRRRRGAAGGGPHPVRHPVGRAGHPRHDRHRLRRRPGRRQHRRERRGLRPRRGQPGLPRGGASHPPMLFPRGPASAR